MSWTSWTPALDPWNLSREIFGLSCWWWDIIWTHRTARTLTRGQNLNAYFFCQKAQYASVVAGQWLELYLFILRFFTPVVGFNQKGLLFQSLEYSRSKIHRFFVHRLNMRGWWQANGLNYVYLFLDFFPLLYILSEVSFFSESRVLAVKNSSFFLSTGSICGGGGRPMAGITFIYFYIFSPCCTFYQKGLLFQSLEYSRSYIHHFFLSTGSICGCGGRPMAWITSPNAWLCRSNGNCYHFCHST